MAANIQPSNSSFVQDKVGRLKAGHKYGACVQADSTGTVLVLAGCSDVSLQKFTIILGTRTECQATSNCGACT